MSDNPYPTIITYYTQNWEYARYAELMKRDCIRLGLEHYIVEKETTGSWIKNTTMKPSFILEALEEVKRPVLWIDADGSIMHKPALLNEDYPHDFAARPTPPNNPRQWHVGTMYFKYNERALEFLKTWIARMEVCKGTDELALDLMWKQNGPAVQNISAGELPATYFEFLKHLHFKPAKSTIVCHRGSRDSDKMAMKQRHRGKLENARSK